jgi:hypothetical protein
MTPEQRAQTGALAAEPVPKLEPKKGENPQQLPLSPET